MASSASIYGMAEDFPTTEQHHPYDNRTLYGAAKAFGEGLLRSFNDMYGTNYVACATSTSTARAWTSTAATPRCWSAGWSGSKPVSRRIIFGDGKQTMDMVHVRDVARANILAAISPASDVALNVGSGTETSLLDLARHLARSWAGPTSSRSTGRSVRSIRCRAGSPTPISRAG